MVSVMQSNHLSSSASIPRARPLQAWKNLSLHGSPSTLFPKSASSTVQNRTPAEENVNGNSLHTIGERDISTITETEFTSAFMGSKTAYINPPWSFIKTRELNDLEKWLSRNSECVNNLNDELGLSMLHISAARGLRDFCEILLKHGADLKLKSKKGCGVIHLAARHGSEVVIELLLDRDSTLLSQLSEDGWTCVHEAVANAKNHVIPLLVQRGADIDQPMEGKLETPLMTAIKSKNLLTIETVLHHKPNLNLQNSSGVTALLMTSGSGHPIESFQKLLEFGADMSVVSKRGASCVHVAARYGRLDVLEMVLSRNPVVFDIKTDDNWTPLHEAADTNQVEVIEYILSRTPVSIDAQTSTGNTALHLAARKVHLEAFSTLCSLDQMTPNVSFKNKNEQTVGDILLSHAQTATAQKMLDLLQKLDKNPSNNKNQTSKKKSRDSVQIENETKVDSLSKTVDIFLSYSWTDSKLVDEIYEKLTGKAFHVWQDKHKIGPGDNLYGKIQEGIQECKVFVPCLSLSYLSSENARSEFHLAKLWKKPIIPLIFDRELTKKWPPVSELAPLLAPLVYLLVINENNVLVNTEIDKLCTKIRAIEIDHSI